MLNPQQYVNHKVIVKRDGYEVVGHVRSIGKNSIDQLVIHLFSVVECVTDDWIGGLDVVWIDSESYTIGIIE